MKEFMSRKLSLLFKIVLLTLLVLMPKGYAEEAETIKIGWIPHEGYQNYINGVPSGYTYDYFMEIANYTGWKYDFIPCTLSECIEKLKTGQIDIAGSLLASEERKKIFNFTQNEYGHTYVALFALRESNLEPNNFKQYNGISIGIVQNATVNHDSLRTFAQENNFSYNVVTYPDIQSVTKAVLSKEIDAGMVGAYQENNEIKILSKFSPNPIYFAVTRSNTTVLRKLNQAMNQIRIDNPYLELNLSKKSFSSSGNIKLTEAELAIVNGSKENPINVGVVDSSAPLFYSDSKTSEYKGIAIDMFKLAANKIGLNYKFVKADFNRAKDAKTPLETSPKLVIGITKVKSLPDKRNWFLSDAVIKDTLVLVGRRGEDITNNPSQKTLAIMSGFSMARNYAEYNFPEYKIKLCQNLEECLTAVKKGEADGTLYLRSCVNYLLQKPYFENLEIFPSFSDEIDTLVAAFTDENESLIRIVNKGLNMISDVESRDITLNYTVKNPYKLTITDTIYKYRGPLIIIILLILVVIVSLSTLIVSKQKSSEKLKKAYEQEKIALAAAEQASAAKGNFMSRMSHEIRTPLNAIIGYNTIASNDITEAKNETDYRQVVMKVADCLTKTNIATKHLLTIINDVLDMSAIESGKIKIAHEKFDFKGLINSLTTIFYSQAKSKGVEFEVIFDTLTEEWFVGDQMRTSQILTNLLSNAIKFTPDAGKVTLTITQKQSAQNKAYIHFEVSDTGIGMSSEYLSHIWTPFEQADSSISRRFGGTGLGLAITKNLVGLLEGHIDVSSEQGVGTTFKVDLAFDRTEQPSQKASYDFGDVNALVVDDDASTCDYIRLLMNRFGARCTTVTSGEDAIHTVSMAKENKEPYTVCLVDWRMPKMDGLETVKRIREVAGNDIPIIVITAYDFTEIVEKAADVGITKFISKPLFQSSLFDLLVNICSKQPDNKLEKPTAIRFNKERILLAEDNAMNMEIAEKILETVGLTVDKAWNGQEAVNTFSKMPKGTYKAILMDVQMPVMDGYQATKEIRASEHPDAKDIPIIAMTADAFAENVAEAHAAGMNAHISKPIDLPTLFNTLEEYIK